MNSLKSHPRGLYLLFATELWERFNYYGMRALFILYMTQALLFNKELSSLIYGNFTGLVYLTPLLGGYIADRYWGNRRSILVGAIIMMLGQFFMFLSACYYQDAQLAVGLMILGLVLLIVGNGFFKPNISTMVGSLYAPADSRKDSAYTIFYMGINAGAMVAPLWCGLVGNTGNPADFKWGFLSACVGMLIGTVVFYFQKDRHLVDHEGNPVGLPPQKQPKELNATSPKREFSPTKIIISTLSFAVLMTLFAINWSSPQGLFDGADWIGAMIYSSIITIPVVLFTDSSLSSIERKRIMVIYIIAFFVIFFWAAFEQAGASLTFFADEQTNRVIFGWEMPASYFQSFNALFIIIFAPLFAMLWGWLGKRNSEPSSPAKQAIGLLLLSLGYLIISLGVRGVDPNVKVSMMWLVGLYFIHTMGELCLSPIGLSMVNKLSPARFASLLMGVWFLSLSAANKLSGVLSGYYPEGAVSKSFMGYEVATLSDFFMLFVIMSGAAAIILFALTTWLNKLISAEE
ncbi:MAG: peptide MFS transporter [Rikenellaceae bacterium]